MFVCLRENNAKVAAESELQLKQELNASQNLVKRKEEEAAKYKYEVSVSQPFLPAVPLNGINRPLPSCLSPLFQSESYCKAFHMKIRFILMQILVHLHVNKTIVSIWEALH